MKHVGLPLVGDMLYSRQPDPAILDRVFLHAWRLAFNHPVTGDPLSFRSPLPEELVRYLQSFLSNGRGR
jgi:23S rRNA pseudouridine1911/1915/1917 synthase